MTTKQATGYIGGTPDANLADCQEPLGPDDVIHPGVYVYQGAGCGPGFTIEGRDGRWPTFSAAVQAAEGMGLRVRGLVTVMRREMGVRIIG